jgi:hypothetical protein
MKNRNVDDDDVVVSSLSQETEMLLCSNRFIQLLRVRSLMVDLKSEQQNHLKDMVTNDMKVSKQSLFNNKGKLVQLLLGINNLCLCFCFFNLIFDF